MTGHTLSGKIMVVDDSAFDRARLVAVVKSLGCQAIEVPHADQVVEIAIEEKPVMILMDVIMGPPNGFEVCRTLRENSKTTDIPVILCSVKSTTVDHKWAKQQGAMGYLAKPIDPAKTRDFISRQWTRFQEALVATQEKTRKEQEVASMLSSAVLSQASIQEKISSISSVDKAPLDEAKGASTP